jgi:hypothetical protein
MRSAIRPYISVDVLGVLPLKRQLELLMMPSSHRRHLLYRVSKNVIQNSRKRIQAQMDLQGASFEPGHKPETDRHSHKRKRKMLSGLVKGRNGARVLSNDGLIAKIGFPGKAGQIAAKQQYGASEVIDMVRMQTLSGEKRTASNSARYAAQAFAPATKRQAKELRDLGFKPRSGKRRLANRDIMGSMTKAQAGVIIRSMRTKQGYTPKQRWTTRLPPRSFLGASPQEVFEYINLISDQILRRIPHGSR